MRKLLLIISCLAVNTAAWAATVTSTPGGLEALVTNTGETSLTVKGSIDARDFRFIADKLDALTTLDISAATVVAYQADKALFGNATTYAAGAVPPMALAGKSKLTTVSLPASATTLGSGALAGCTALKTLTLPAGLVTIDAYALAGCTALTTVTLPATLEYLGDGAFRRCTALKTVMAASGANAPLTVGDEAFADCSALKTLTLSSRLASIGERAFAASGLATLDLSQYTTLQSVGNYAFVKTKTTTVKFPNSVTAIGRGAFLYNPTTTVTLPTGLKSVEPYTFAGSSITAADLGSSSVETVGERAFFAAKKMTTVKLPATTARLDEQAMARMTALSDFTVKATEVPALGDDVWQGVRQSSVALKVPTAAIDDYKDAEQWREFNVQQSYLIGDANNDGVVDIGDVNAIINNMLGKPNQGEFVPEAADTDGSGLIDIEDVNNVINIILRRMPGEAPMMTPDTDDALAIHDFDIMPGERRTIAVELSNATRYAAMQCDLVMPQGLTIVDITTADGAAEHSLATATEDNITRVLCYSLAGQALGSGNVLAITVEATDDLVAGTRVTVERTVLATPDSQVSHCGDTFATVSTTTGVDDLNAVDTRVWADGGTLYIESEQPTTAQLVAVNGTCQTLAVLAGRNAYDGLATGIYVVRIGAKSHKVAVK